MNKKTKIVIFFSTAILVAVLLLLLIFSRAHQIGDEFADKYNSGFLDKSGMPGCVAYPLNEIEDKLELAKGGEEAETGTLCMDQSESFSRWTMSQYSDKSDEFNLIFECPLSSTVCYEEGAQSSKEGTAPIGVDAFGISANNPARFNLRITCSESDEPAIHEDYTCRLSVVDD
jgi:hypothetical protein